MYTSPFTRTVQTARVVSAALGDQVERNNIEPRIREQEFGNMQDEHFSQLRKDQMDVGRFWFRFPTGESGADVYGRVKQWWTDSVMVAGSRPGVPTPDNLVVTTHGLTMRLILMQLRSWSPNTFHTVWNAQNCDIYVLERDPRRSGLSPYSLSQAGDQLRSTIDLLCHFIDGSTRLLKLDDYHKLPAPRTSQEALARRRVAEQHGIDPSDIVKVEFRRMGWGERWHGSLTPSHTAG